MMLLSSSSRKVDAFLVSPQLLSSAAAAVCGRRESGVMEAIAWRKMPSSQTSQRVRQMVVGMVSAAAVDGLASTSKEDGDAAADCLSLGERLRADFPILDQVCLCARNECIGF